VARLSRSSEQTRQVERECVSRSAAISESFAQTTAAAEVRLAELRAALNDQHERSQQALEEVRAAEERIGAQGGRLAEASAEAENKLSQLRLYFDDSSRQQQNAEMRLNEQMTKIAALAETTSQDLEQHAAKLVETTNRAIARSAEDGMTRCSEHIRLTQENAGREIERLSDQMKAESTSALRNLAEKLEDMEKATTAARESFQSGLENIARRAEVLIGDATRQMEESSREAAAKWAAEISDRANDATCATFEVLANASAWYRKKIQTETESIVRKGSAEAAGNLGTQSEAASRGFSDTIMQLDEQSLRGYEERLEKVSTASLEQATKKFGRETQEQLETMARSAELRLRQVCNEVLAEIGENLRQGLLLSKEKQAGQS
jgi:hypothetical protein